MAYFETLGQLQNNDETFTEIYSSNTSNTFPIILNNSHNIQKDDIIMGVIGSVYYDNSIKSKVSNVVFSGCSILFETNDYSGNGAYSNTIYIYIGKVIDGSISLSSAITGAAPYIRIYRLVPR